MSLYAVKSADGFAGIAVKSTESLATELMVASSERKKSTTTRKESEMASENETVSDIVADMRNESHAGDASCLEWVVAKIRGYADRIEAAMRHQFREVTKMIPHEEVTVSKMETTNQAREKSSAVGNAAKMRAALEDAEKVLDDSSHSMCGIPPHMNDLLARIRAALSAPPRNCDVLSKDEVLKVLDDSSFYKEDTIEWLYAEAKEIRNEKYNG